MSEEAGPPTGPASSVSSVPHDTRIRPGAGAGAGRVGRVQTLAEQTLAAIGRMTVAATDLEHLLAWIGADHAGGDAAAVFALPGEPLRAARAAVEFAAASCREELIRYVEAAGTQLAQSQAAIRVLWWEGGRRDPAMFDEITDRLVKLRAALGGLVESHRRAG